jgi:uroporphyrinogen III methyltransferase/synthase
MSLRGSETTEAISQRLENKEIIALPSVARNDKPRITPQSHSGEGGVRGKKILITRAREQSGDFAKRLRKLGAKVIEFPTIEVVPPTRWNELDQAIDQLKSYDWILFTSVNGVHFFWQRLKERRKSSHLPPSLKICAIGPATAKKLKEKGVPVHFIPKAFIAESILEGFKKKSINGKKILLARAKKARDILPKGLRKMGTDVDVVEAYRTVRPRSGSKKLKKLLAEGKIDIITFTSSSTVNHFTELLKKENLKKLLKGMAIACIGPVTARTAKERGLKVQIQPRQYTIPGLTRAIVEYFASPPSLSPERTCRNNDHRR